MRAKREQRANLFSIRCAMSHQQTLSLVGSVLYLVGSIGFLPYLEVPNMGIFGFVIGSAFIWLIVSSTSAGPCPNRLLLITSYNHQQYRYHLPVTILESLPNRHNQHLQPLLPRIQALQLFLRLLHPRLRRVLCRIRRILFLLVDSVLLAWVPEHDDHECLGAGELWVHDQFADRCVQALCYGTLDDFGLE